MRMEKVMRDRQMSQEEALEYIMKYDANQIAFIRKYFNEDINNPALRYADQYTTCRHRNRSGVH